MKPVNDYLIVREIEGGEEKTTAGIITGLARAYKIATVEFSDSPVFDVGDTIIYPVGVSKELKEGLKVIKEEDVYAKE